MNTLPSKDLFARYWSAFKDRARVVPPVVEMFLIFEPNSSKPLMFASMDALSSTIITLDNAVPAANASIAA